MIVEEIQGNIAHLSPDEKNIHTEKVYLENSDLVKRIQRVTTDHGNEIGIRLKIQSTYNTETSYTKMTTT